MVGTLLYFLMGVEVKIFLDLIGKYVWYIGYNYIKFFVCFFLYLVFGCLEILIVTIIVFFLDKFIMVKILFG